MLIWENDRIRLGVLKRWLDNPRKSNEKQRNRIVSSHESFGQVETIAIGPDDEIYNGHQRLESWLNEYGEDFVVDVRRSSRKLEEDEKRALTALLHVGATGSWDWDILLSWDNQFLQDFGFDEDLLGEWQSNTTELDRMLEVVPDFQPVGEEEQPRLDEKKSVYCPHCGKNIHDDPIES